MPDYLPRPDSVFDSWVADFIEYATSHSTELGLTDREAAELQKARKAWSQAFGRHQLAKETARLATDDKEQKRAEVEQAIRKYVRVIQARPATTNQQRRELGISLKSEEQQETPAAGTAMIISEINLAGY